MFLFDVNFKFRFDFDFAKIWTIAETRKQIRLETKMEVFKDIDNERNERSRRGEEVWTFTINVSYIP